MKVYKNIAFQAEYGEINDNQDLKFGVGPSALVLNSYLQFENFDFLKIVLSISGVEEYRYFNFRVKKNNSLKKLVLKVKIITLSPRFFSILSKDIINRNFCLLLLFFIYGSR